jgi:hypothetical protein
MQTSIRPLVVSVAVLAWSAPAAAQPAYVAAGVGADIFRPRRVEARGLDDATSGGEAVAFSARVGTAMTDRWGVELEFTRARDIERELRRGFPLPLVARPVGGGVLVPDTVLPVFESTIRLSRSNATLDAVAWVAQPVGSRVDLVYLGGIAFTRAVERMQFAFGPRGLLSPTLVLPNSTRTTTYGAGPVAGLEARVRLTDHVLLVPGVRLHGIDGGSGTAAWLVRPAAALGWQF